MKYLLFTLVLGLTISCAAPSSVQTPAGKAAYTADQLINSLGVFQDAAIGANSQKLLSDNNTRLIVLYVKSAVITIQTAPAGWKVTLATGLDQLSLNLGSDAVKYQTYISLLKSIIISL